MPTVPRVFPHGWTREDFLTTLSKEYGENPIIRGPVQIVKGTEPVIGVTHELLRAINHMFDSDLCSALDQRWFADIALTDGDDVIQVKLKTVFGIQAQTKDHIIISCGLASQLGLKTPKDIKILGVHASTDDLDLDKWGKH